MSFKKSKNWKWKDWNISWSSSKKSSSQSSKKHFKKFIQKSTKIIKKPSKNLQEIMGKSSRRKSRNIIFRGPDIQGKIEDEKKIRWSNPGEDLRSENEAT